MLGMDRFHLHRNPDHPVASRTEHIPQPLIFHVIQKVFLIVDFKLQFENLLCPQIDIQQGAPLAPPMLEASSQKLAAYFLSSTSTYSASITPSSFLA
jgi:hypothetical protein